MSANDSSPDVHEMSAIFGDQAAACGLFARPGQVSAELPAPDQCMRCGRLESEHAADAGDLGCLVAALIAAGTSVSFVLDPGGVVAHVDVVGEDDAVITHTGIAATPATLAGHGGPVVPAARPPHLSAVGADAPATTPTDARSHLSPQVGAAALRDRRDSSGQGHQAAATPGQAGAKPVAGAPVPGPTDGGRGPLPGHPEPVPGHPGEAGAELSVEACVEGLDGSQRIILLNHIAQAFPEVVEAGLALVAEWRAECAGRRRKALRRREHDRRRRRRVELGDE